MIEDFIRIRNDNEDCSVFQGIGIEIASSTSDSGFPALSFSAALWAAQTAAIQGETDYLNQLNALYKQKYKLLSDNQSLILEVFEEIFGEIVGGIAEGIALSSGISTAAAPWVGLVVGFVSEIGIGMVFDKILSLLTDGNKLIDAMIAENTAIIDLPEAEHTRDNYQLREAVQLRHLQQIELILSQIATAEKELREALPIGGGYDQLAEDFRKAFLEKIIEVDEFGNPVEDGAITFEGFLNQRLEDLKYNDEILYLPGNLRVHLKNKLIHY